ncbi:MAG TPA: hypothetical protein VKM55_00635 [Candidatus Lokiarchaeia archaeon]|nr:hypothetical protein [Candidatus Lokiarchaeia archaeon]
MGKSKINLGDLIFILFYKFNGMIRGSTTLQKLIDIIRLDSEFDVDGKYDPYNFGDFSQDVVDVLNVYVDNDWVLKTEEQLDHDKTIDIFRLSETGMKIAKTVYGNMLHRDKEKLEIIDDFKDKSQNEIISYSYFWYPATAIKPIINDRVFGRIPLSKCETGFLEEEFNAIKNSHKTVKELIHESWG